MSIAFLVTHQSFLHFQLDKKDIHHIGTAVDRLLDQYYSKYDNQSKPR